ncbi:MAG: hypothetical protein AAF789_11755 [Bacteroidota bacterium]
MKRYLFIAGVIDSRGYTLADSKAELLRLLKWANTLFAQSLERPLVPISEIDLFLEGLILKESEAIDLLFNIEEYLIEENLEMKLAYYIKDVTFYEGAIGQVGSEEILSRKKEIGTQRIKHSKKLGKRFLIETGNRSLGKIMEIGQHFLDGWKPKDRSTVTGFLQGHDYKVLARMHGKDESSLWRRKKSLSIDHYLTCKELAQMLANQVD